MATKASIAVLASSLVAAGCVSSPADPTSKAIEATYTEVKNTYSATKAPELPFTDSAQYIRSGILTVDTNCNTFFRRLSEYNRRTSAAQNGINLLGGTTAGILAATDTAAKSISLAAIGFAGIEGQVKNYRDYELLAPYAGNAQDLIAKAQATYRVQPWPTDHIDAATYIKGYAKLCTYDSIQRYINDAVRKADTEVAAPEQSGAVPVAQRKIVEDALPTLALKALNDVRLARLYWFLTGGLSATDPRKQFTEEFPELAASLTEPAKPNTLSALGEQAVAQLGALTIRDPAFKALVQVNIDNYAKAQAQADAAAKQDAKNLVAPTVTSLSEKVKTASNDAVEGKTAAPAAPGTPDPLDLALQLQAKAASVTALAVRLPATPAPPAPSVQWGGPPQIVIK